MYFIHKYEKNTYTHQYDKHSSTLINTHQHSLPLITTHYHSLPLITTHYHSLPLINTPQHSSTLINMINTFTGWRRLIGSPKLQIIFHKRATKYRSLLRKMTYKDKGSYESSPPCIRNSKICTFAEYRLFYRVLLQKRPVILRRLLTKATPYLVSS